MARRSKDWNVGLAQDLRDPNFAREFLLAAIEDGVSIQIALGKVIRAIGIKEFSARTKIASPNILRAINPRHNPTQETLNRLLKPFRLKLSLAPIEQPNVSSRGIADPAISISAARPELLATTQRSCANASLR